MAFVNEHIPKEDLENYDFEALNQRPLGGGGSARDWTIDRQGGIWLRQFHQLSNHTLPHGGYTGHAWWDFYWKGSLLLVGLQEIAGESSDRSIWKQYKLLSIDLADILKKPLAELFADRHVASANLPDALKEQLPQILSDLQAAFTVHRLVGVYDDEVYDYTFILEVDGVIFKSPTT